MITCTVDPLLAQHLRQAPGIILTSKAIHLDPNKYAFMAEGTMGLVFVVLWLKISIKVSFDAGIFMAGCTGKELRASFSQFWRRPVMERGYQKIAVVLCGLYPLPSYILFDLTFSMQKSCHKTFLRFNDVTTSTKHGHKFCKPPISKVPSMPTWV